jgi:hypothetical protein
VGTGVGGAVVATVVVGADVRVVVKVDGIDVRATLVPVAAVASDDVSAVVPAPPLLENGTEEHGATQLPASTSQSTAQRTAINNMQTNNLVFIVGITRVAVCGR